MNDLLHIITCCSTCAIIIPLLIYTASRCLKSECIMHLKNKKNISNSNIDTLPSNV